MGALECIYSICVIKTKINDLPKWKFISIRKENKLLEKKHKDFFNYDIFDMTNAVISFLLATENKDTLEELGYYNINIKDNYLSVYINEHDILVEFFSKSNRFQVSEETITYSVYRNSKSSRFIQIKWDIISEILKLMYYDIIMQLIDYTHA
jgi:hypothetical protein